MLEFQELTKRYGSRLAVDGLSFTVEPGKVTGFLGPNGAGKSTTMRLALGLDHPSAGRALVGGKPYRDWDQPLCVVGAQISPNAGHPGQSPLHFLTGLARSNRIPTARVGEMLEQVGLGQVRRRRIGSFSLGMRQRLGIAAALLGDPPVLVFDEPMNGLDAEGIAWIRRLLRQLADEGRTVFISSHLMGEMQQCADQLVLIGRGRLLANDSMAHLLEAAGGTTIRVRSAQDAALREVLERRGFSCEPAGERTLLVRGAQLADAGAAAFEHGIQLEELSEHHGSLERAYEQLTGAQREFSATDISKEQQR